MTSTYNITKAEAVYQCPCFESSTARYRSQQSRATENVRGQRTHNSALTSDPAGRVPGIAEVLSWTLDSFVAGIQIGQRFPADSGRVRGLRSFWAMETDNRSRGGQPYVLGQYV